MKHNNVITNECVRILYDNATASNVTVILSSFIMSYIFKDQIPISYLITWIGFMLTLSLIRFWLLSDYKKTKENITNHKFFESRYAYLTTGIGLGWAMFIFWGLNIPLFEYRLYSILLLTAIIAIASPLFSSSIRTLYFYLAPSVLITLPQLFLGDGKDQAIAIALCIFTIMVIRSTKNINNTLIDVLNLKFKTQEMNKNINQLHHEKSETEKRMQSLIDHAPAAIYIKDLDGHFTFLNKKVADLHHLPREEIIGKTLHDILPKNIADDIQQNDIDVIREKLPIEYQESVPQDDGLHHYISIKFPLLDDAGKIYAVAGVSTDITERYRIEETLRISQQRLLLHREQSPFGVIEWNTNFEFIDWNPAAERIFGYTKAEVQGRHISDLILPESEKSAVIKIWNKLLTQTGGTYSLNKNITKDGLTILCEWHNTALIDHEGIVIGVTSLVENVTKRQENENTLRHSQKMDAIGKLTGGIAHDFNNMLAVILGFSELLKNHLSDNDYKSHKYNEEIVTAAERAKKLTSKLLEFSRKTPSSDELTQISTLLVNMQHMLEKTITPRITLKLNVDNTVWSVWLDKARLEDAILNISINAMHAMPNGGLLTISLKNKHLDHTDVQNLTISAGDYVMLTIEDTGIGMTKEIQSKIFDPFYSTKGTQGTGLGLSQVYGFIQQSRCDIQVLTEPNKGTQFTLYIPRYKGSHVTHTEKPAPELNKTVSGKETILVVDDEIALLDLTTEILLLHNYSVLRATNAEEALDILENNTVDLLISDVIMPGMDGFQLATEVENKYPDIKIQIVSGFSNDSNLKLKNNYLYQQLIRKPYNINNLLKRIRDLLDS
ncbi:MAG: PAS domain S-box protein [Gammaproteobacteria bacterium]|nr:PAS domain S-box protein [Gammaproteobacteria bacterium]